jgi:DNA mismatch repair ATPase MutS
MKTLKAATVNSMLITVVMILISAISFAGQKAGDDKATSKDVKQETMEAIEAIKKYTVDKKDEAVREVKVVLEDLDTRIDRIQSRIENKWNEMDQASRESARKTIQALRKKRNELSEWYGGMKHSSADAWDHVKEGFVEGYEAVANAFDKAENELSSDESGKSGS